MEDRGPAGYRPAVTGEEGARWTFPIALGLGVVAGALEQGETGRIGWFSRQSEELEGFGRLEEKGRVSRGSLAPGVHFASGAR